MRINKNLWKSMEIYKNLQNTWKSIGINGNLCKDYENPWKSMKINEIHNIYGIYLFRTKKMGYILYSKHIHASHICPPKRNKWFNQRTWKLSFLWKHWHWPVKHISKWLFRWKPGMIPRSLRSSCPRRFPLKAR